MSDLPFKFLILAPFLDSDSQGPEEPLAVTSLEEAFEGLKPSLYIPLPEGISSERGIHLAFQSLKDFRPREIASRIPGFTGRSKPPSEEGAVLEDLLSKVALPEESSSEEKGLEFVYHHPRFRTLESTWRGLQFFLADGLPEEVSVFLVPSSLEHLPETLDRLLPRFINHPPSVILVEIPLEAVPYHLEVLKRIAHFAESLLTPAVVCAGPGFLHLDRWEDLERLPYLPHYLEASPWASWHTLKAQTSGEWLSMILGGIVLRHPYLRENPPLEEKIPLMGSAIWVLARLIKESLYKTGWPFHLTAQEGIRLQGPELAFTFPEKRISQFLEAGLYPLNRSPYTGEVFFPELKTLRGTSLAFQFLVSRLSHFLILLRSQTEKEFTSAEEVREHIHQKMEELWRRRGGLSPEELAVEVRGTSEGFLVTLKCRPPRPLLPLKEPVTFSFIWS